MAQFETFPKIPRLNNTEWVLTEKLDGTNAQILIEEAQFGASLEKEAQGAAPLTTVLDNDRIGTDGLPDFEFHFYAGSRNRWLTVGADNYGFAAWVVANAPELARLGRGRHFGEWYGAGVQRGYGLGEKRFALFNTRKWSDPFARPGCCEVVTVLGVPQGAVLNSTVDYWLDRLREFGSYHVPGFDKPEGLVVYHPASGQLYKALCENDMLPKSVVKSDLALAR